MLQEADPPLGHSISIATRHLGTLYFCQEYSGAVPADSVVNWQDGDSFLCLRPSAQPNVHSSYSSEVGKIHDGGINGGVWAIGNQTLCKVKAWLPNQQLEGKTIEWVKARIPDMPITDVIYQWVDKAWARSFMLMRRAPGEDLNVQMGKLNNVQLYTIAKQVASYSKQLARYTSTKIETVDGYGLEGGYFLGDYNDGYTWPSCKPDIHPVYTPESLRELLRKQSGIEPPDCGELIFTHIDLNPMNLMVTDDGKLTAIIGWGHAGYWPSWVATTIPIANSFFGLNTNRWRERLWGALIDFEGFRVDEMPWYRKHRQKENEAQANDPKFLEFTKTWKHTWT